MQRCACPLCSLLLFTYFLGEGGGLLSLTVLFHSLESIHSISTSGLGPQFGGEGGDPVCLPRCLELSLGPVVLVVTVAPGGPGGQVSSLLPIYHTIYPQPTLGMPHVPQLSGLHVLSCLVFSGQYRV